MGGDEGLGLDYIFARYHGAELGRSLSVDPAAESVALETPTTWNRYAYVLNNPLVLLDPDGRAVVHSDVRDTGPNRVPKPSLDQSIALRNPKQQLATLGTKSGNRGFVHALNIEFQVSSGDSPSNYRVSGEAYSFKVVGKALAPVGKGGRDDPEKGKPVDVVQDLVAFDTPGVETDGPAASYSATTVQYFRYQAVTKRKKGQRKGQPSGDPVYFRVELTVSSGVARGTITKITKEEFDKRKKEWESNAP